MNESMQTPYELSNEQRRWVDEKFSLLCNKLTAEKNRVGFAIPYIAKNGRYQDDMAQVFPGWWTNGFWAGIMWSMAYVTAEPIPAESIVSKNASHPQCVQSERNPILQDDSASTIPFYEYARYTEHVLDGVLDQWERVDHDAGFLWLLSAVADYRISENPRARVRALHAASMLASRFNPQGNFLRAWNESGREGWTIVDSMMNIPLLYWASEQTGDPRFAQIATLHAQTIARYVVREDGSCNHIVCFDPQTGEYREAPAGQGYAAGSAWSRGQAWALYGFALAYRHTGNQQFLDIAKRVAHYFCAQSAVTNGLARCDFRQPNNPERWDAIASCIAVCGLLEIAEHVPTAECQSYVDWAMYILQAVDETACDWQVDTDGIVGLCTVQYHDTEDIHVPIVYADYFLTEALMRLKGYQLFFW